jgi:crotonobetainyl-CoA:carnitine CoA-transferase CaiB-like acyl-CoA transferase
MMGGPGSYMTGTAREKPLARRFLSVNDIMGGMFGAIGAMAALMQRAVTGRGQEVQSALYENNVFLVAQHMMQFAATGVPAAPMPGRISAWAVYDVFTVKDGEQIFLAAVSDSQWAAFCAAFGYADLKADLRLATNNDRVRARDWLIPILRERFAVYSAAELSAIFEKNALPFAPITRPEELFDDPHLNQTGGLAPLTMPDGSQTKVPLLPLTLDGERPGIRLQPPRLGEHSTQLLGELGYSDAEIVAMAASGVIAA